MAGLVERGIRAKANARAAISRLLGRIVGARALASEPFEVSDIKPERNTPSGSFLQRVCWRWRLSGHDHMVPRLVAECFDQRMECESSYEA
jgi:hypothetical protein